MRTIQAAEITEAVRRLCIEANLYLSPDMERAVRQSEHDEASETGKGILRSLGENLDAARRLCLPICQDTGMAVVFCDVGQELHIEGGLLSDAVNEGVRRGYLTGKLRCSVVADPLSRVNTGDNTPAVLHTRLTAGDRLSITVAPKGFGSENMSALRMLTPAAGRQDVIDFIVHTVGSAGSNPCPPVVVGVGIGGTFEYAAQLAKRALVRPLDAPQESEYYRELERDALRAVNALGVGPQGFGGTVTALAVQVEVYPTHIAGLPVAVNMGCHVNRHASAVL